MRATAVVMVAVVLAGTSSAARADENKELILSSWVVTYSDAAKQIPVGTKLEFTGKGKINVTVRHEDGSEVTKDGGGYKIDAQYITLLGVEGNLNNKGRVCLLNGTSCIIHDEVEDKVMVLKRVKAK